MKFNLKESKISTRLLILLAIAIVVPGVGIVFSFTKIVSYVEQRTGIELRDNVIQTAHAIDDFMEAKSLDLNAISNSPIFYVAENEDISTHLLTRREADPTYDVLHFVGPEGEILASSESHLVGKNLLQIEPDIKEQFSQALQGKSDKVFISELSDYSGEPKTSEDLDLEMMSDVSNGNDEVIGVLVGVINVSYIRDQVYQLDDLTVGDEYAYLVNDKGDILISLDPNAEVMKPHPDSQLEAVGNGVFESDDDDYVIYENIRERSVINAFADLGEYGANEVGDWSLLAIAPYSTIMAEVNQIILSLSIIMFISVCLIAFVGMVISKSISAPLVQLQEYSQKLAEGDLPDETFEESNNEIGKVMASYNVLIDGLKKTAGFAIEVGKGNLDTPFEKLGDNDKLGDALIQMRDSLKDISDKDQQRNWVNEGIAKFGTILRDYNDNIEKFAIRAVAELVNYLDGTQGAFFVVDENEQDGTYLELAGYYAYDRVKHMKRKCMPGEGLVGQALLEKKPTLITNTPKDYLRVVSGLGDAPPNCIYIFPIMVNEEIYGVIELASFNLFVEHQLEFLEKLGETMASAIKNLKVNERTSKLLLDSQELQEDLKNQEEELKQNMEEMTAIREEQDRVLQSKEKKIKELESQLKQN